LAGSEGKRGGSAGIILQQRDNGLDFLGILVTVVPVAR